MSSALSPCPVTARAAATQLESRGQAYSHPRRQAAATAPSGRVSSLTSSSARAAVARWTRVTPGTRPLASQRRWAASGGRGAARGPAGSGRMPSGARGSAAMPAIRSGATTGGWAAAPPVPSTTPAATSARAGLRNGIAGLA